MFSLQIKMSWNIFRLTLRVLKDRDTCLEWCREQELLPREKNCHKCNRKMTFDPDRGLRRFRCRYDHRGRGTIEISAAKGTWFENAKTSPSKIVLLAYAFATDSSYETAVRESSIDEKVTSRGSLQSQAGIHTVVNAAS
jgi:hypothetical protein